MRAAALTIGLMGAFAAFFGAIIAVFFGGVGAALEAEGGETVIGLGFAAIGLSIVGLVGAALSLAKPRAAAVLMVVSAIGGLTAIFVAYMLGATLLLIAAFFAFLGRKERDALKEA